MPTEIVFTIKPGEGLDAMHEACLLARELNLAYPHSRCAALLVENLRIAVGSLVATARHIKPEEDSMLGQPVRVHEALNAPTVEGVCVGRAQMLSGKLLYAVAPSREKEDECRWVEVGNLERITDRAPDVSHLNEAERA